MSSFPAPRHRYTYAEYLSVDEQGTHRHEYFDGEIYAMPGGTPAHAALTAAFVGTLYAQLQGKPCRVYSSDLRLRVLETGLATYPDVSVVCGPLEGDPAGKDTATNPKLIVEVLSDSTEAYDRGAKRKHYQRIASLEQYALVSQHERQIEVWRRSGDEWSALQIGAGGRVELDSIGCFVDVDTLYAVL